MHKARAFFFVCAGLLLLALSYHLGARSAGAQSSGSMEAASFASGYNSGSSVAFVVNRVLYTSYQLSGSLQWRTPALSAGTIPGTAPVAATSASAGLVLLTDGDLWLSAGQGSWMFIGNLLGASPTPAQSISIGQLKAKYATPAGK